MTWDFSKVAGPGGYTQTSCMADATPHKDFRIAEFGRGVNGAMSFNTLLFQFFASAALPLRRNLLNRYRYRRRAEINQTTTAVPAAYSVSIKVAKPH